MDAPRIFAWRVGDPVLFGPENGPLSERLVREAWDEAGLKHYSHLYVIGFAIDPKARQFIDSAGKIGLPCTYLQATMDLQMGDLLKNMRSSQIFSVCGLPEVELVPADATELKKFAPEAVAGSGTKSGIPAGAKPSSTGGKVNGAKAKVLATMNRLNPEVPTVTVPGITAMSACAAAVRRLRIPRPICTSCVLAIWSASRVATAGASILISISVSSVSHDTPRRANRVLQLPRNVRTLSPLRGCWAIECEPRARRLLNCDFRLPRPFKRTSPSLPVLLVLPLVRSSAS